LDRYVLSELVKPFLFGVGIFSAIGLAAGVLFDLLRQITNIQLPLTLALQILGLQLPYFMTLAFPMAVLLACLQCFARLSGDGELTALRACGVSFYRLMVPVLLFGLLVTGLTFGFNERLVPMTQHQAKQLLTSPLGKKQLGFQERNIFYQEYGKDWEVKRFFYAQRFDGEAMKGLTILDFTQPKRKQVIAAESATWNAADNTWTFLNGAVYALTADGSTQHVLEFEQQHLRLPRDPLDLTDSSRKPEEMTITQTQQYLAVIQHTGKTRQIRKVEIQLQRKYALPVIAIPFGLIGSPLGASRRRSPSSRGFGLSVLIALGQYLGFFLTNAWGELGLLSPWTAAWAPNLVGIGLGCWLITRAAK
jgi:lipopolysaccharide export system permease protein